MFIDPAHRVARQLITSLALVWFAVALTGCGALVRYAAGTYAGPPETMNDQLSDGARRLVAQACEPFKDQRIVDLHIHDLTAHVHPDWTSPWKPFTRLRTDVYLAAAGVEKGEQLVQQHHQRMLAQIEHMPVSGWWFVYAFDRYHESDGEPNLDRTNFWVHNEQVVAFASAYPDRIVPVISVHPYRPDALDALAKWAARGCRYVKWIPSAQGIDPLDPRLDSYYQAMNRHGMVLLCHTGVEDAMDDHGLGDLDNPHRLRGPLSHGVTVVGLHCGGDENYRDPLDPDAPKRPGYAIFMDLLADPEWDGQLFGDLAMIANVRKSTDSIELLLARPQLHSKLIQGSDYPASAIKLAISTKDLANAGLFSHEEARWLDEIRNYNPLLYDFVLKRTMRHPETGQRFAWEVFTLPPSLPQPGGVGSGAEKLTLKTKP